MLPVFLHEIEKQSQIESSPGKFVDKYNMREKRLLAPCVVNVYDIDSNLHTKYATTWLKTNLIRIENKVLRMAPFRDDPP